MTNGRYLRMLQDEMEAPFTSGIITLIWKRMIALRYLTHHDHGRHMKEVSFHFPTFPLCRSKRSWPEKRISKVFCQSVVWSRSVICWLETSELLPGTPVVHCWLAWWESGAKSVDFAWLWLMGVCWTLWLDWDGWDDGLQVARWIHFIQIWLLRCLHSIYWKYNDIPCQTPCVMCCRRKRAGPDQPHESREEVAGWVSCYTTKRALRWWSFAETGTCQVFWGCACLCICWSWVTRRLRWACGTWDNKDTASFLQKTHLSVFDSAPIARGRFSSSKPNGFRLHPYGHPRGWRHELIQPLAEGWRKRTILGRNKMIQEYTTYQTWYGISI